MDEQKQELFNTYGFDLKSIAEKARANGNVAFAELIEKQIVNIQAIYDAIAQAYSSQGGTNEWNVDVEYVETLMEQ